jgi:hypothetical protein
MATRRITRVHNEEVLAAIRTGKYLWIRAGREHRFIAIWAVVIGRRVYIRSWNVKPHGWHRAFADQKRGAIRLSKDSVEVSVRARHIRSDRIKSAVDHAYAEKYTTPSSLKYVRGFRTARRRNTTIELVPE